MDIRSIIRDQIQRWGIKRRAWQLTLEANKKYSTGNFTEAAGIYGNAVGLDPDKALYRYNYGLALYKSGERRRAREEWRKALALVSNNKFLQERIEIVLRQYQ